MPLNIDLIEQLEPKEATLLERTAARELRGRDALDHFNIALISKIKEWDLNNYMANGGFALPQELREQIQRVLVLRVRRTTP